MKQKVKKITIIFLLLLPIFLIIFFNMGTKIDRNIHIDEYKDYYICRLDYEELLYLDLGLGGGPDKYTSIWFWPFQKGKLLKKIKEDVNNILTDIQMTNEYGMVDYKISDDFKDVTIYTDDYGTYMQMSFIAESDVIDSRYLTSEIGMRVTLYHDLIQNSHEPDYGNVNVPYWGDVVNLVYNGSEADKEQWFREQEEKEREKLGYLIPGDHP